MSEGKNGVLVGYARVSTVGQSLEIQEDALSSVGCSKVFKEKKLGGNRGWLELERCLEFLREGNTLIVTKFARIVSYAWYSHVWNSLMLLQTQRPTRTSTNRTKVSRSYGEVLTKNLSQLSEQLVAFDLG